VYGARFKTLDFCVVVLGDDRRNLAKRRIRARRPFEREIEQMPTTPFEHRTRTRDDRGLLRVGHACGPAPRVTRERGDDGFAQRATFPAKRDRGQFTMARGPWGNCRIEPLNRE